MQYDCPLLEQESRNFSFLSNENSELTKVKIGEIFQARRWDTLGGGDFSWGEEFRVGISRGISACSQRKGGMNTRFL